STSTRSTPPSATRTSFYATPTWLRGFWTWSTGSGYEGAPEIASRLAVLAEPAPDLTAEEKAQALQAFLWFLERAGDDGFELTSAGYLKPDDVVAASRIVPTMADWIGKMNREVNAVPLLDFRETLRRI